jgi:hypothetical protein
LAEAGAQPGDDAEIAGRVFVFRPEDWVGDDDDELEDEFDEDGGPMVFEIDAQDDDPGDDR